jgi:hypothetical protein
MKKINNKVMIKKFPDVDFAGHQVHHLKILCFALASVQDLLDTFIFHALKVG